MGLSRLVDVESKEMLVNFGLEVLGNLVRDQNLLVYVSSTFI